jgi:class 3 adenylate cyclase
MNNHVAPPKAAVARPPCRTEHRPHHVAVVHPHHEVTTMMFTDIVDSTELLAASGDDVWVEFLMWHDVTLRHLLRMHGGREVKQVGDGFFAVFDNPLCALTCALAVVGLLSAPGPGRPSVSVRVGIHRAEVVRLGRDYVGRGVHEAARIAALARGGEVLASADSVPEADGAVAVADQRRVSLRGLDEPVDVVSVTGVAS